MRLRYLLIAFAALLAACASKGGPASAPPTASTASAFDTAQAHERILVAGQPTQSDLAQLRERGISHVFNLRAAEEMTALGFDESAELAALGIGYQQHPVPGGKAFTPELLAAFAEQVKAGDGKILLHCASGARAAQLYAAYAVKHLGLGVDAAMRTLEPFGGWPLPLERMTGEHLSVVRASEVLHTGTRSVRGNAVDSALGRSDFATCPQ
jgi:uncharacterized protein (TIGR01244 family)